MGLEPRRTLVAIAAAVAICAASFVGPIYFLLVLAGPPVTGAIAGARGVRWAYVAITWGVAGIATTIVDYVINREDVVFHIAVTVVMLLTSLAGWAVGAKIHRRRQARG